MNMTQESYLGIPEEQFQQFIEKFIIKVRPHSQSTVCQIFKSLAGYWNYHLQSILAQKEDDGPMDLTKRSYFNTPGEQFQQFIQMFIIKFRPHSQSNFYLIFKSLAGYWNYHLQCILAQKRDDGPMNLTLGGYLSTPEEWFEHFIEKFIIKFRPHNQ